MWAQSPAWMRAILRSHRVVGRVEWSPDRGLTWFPVGVAAGQITADRTSQVRWSIDATLRPGTPVGRTGIHPYGVRLRASRGVWLPRGDVEYTPLGVYRVNSARTGSDGQVRVQGVSLEQQVKDASLLTSTTIGGPPDSAQMVLEDLVAAAVPDAEFDWRVDGSALLPQVQSDKDRWALIDGNSDDQSIARALGAEVYCNATGRFVIAPTPTIYDPPVWEVRHGQALVSDEVELTREGVFNIVSASGESTDSDTDQPGPGLAWDDDPASLTYAGVNLDDPDDQGPFGRIPRFYTSPLLTTGDQCVHAARSLLADALGLHKQVSFTSVANPALEPGDVVAIEVDPGVIEHHLVDTISLDLVAASMNCTTRATQTRLTPGSLRPTANVEQAAA